MKQFIAIIGPNGAGKSEVCRYLESQGYEVISLSTLVREEAATRGLELTRDNLVATANDLKMTFGPDVLARRVLDKILSENHPKVVFDSVRNVDEIQYLKTHNVVLLGVSAPIEVRYERIVSRAHSTDKIDFATFKAHDHRENSGESSGQNIGAALALCETIVSNDGDIPKMQSDIDAFMNARFGV